jgi:hypothetical protein
MGCGASDFVRAPGGSGRRDNSRGPLRGSPPIPRWDWQKILESFAFDCVVPVTGSNYFACAKARRATVLEFGTWAFVFGITLTVLLIILAALVLWDVLR